MTVASRPRLPAAVQWLLLVVGLVSVAYDWSNRQPNATSDFTIFYESASRPPDRMYDRPVGPPRGNMNPPHFQLLIRPLTALDLSAAAAVWRALNIAALCGCVIWIAVASRERWDLGDIGLLMAWVPMQSVINFNQLTWILWPPLVWAWWAWRRGRWTAGAVGLGIALSFKSFLGVFLLWLLLKRQWRAAIAAVVTAAASVGIGVAVYGVAVFRAWLGTVGRVTWWAAGNNGSVQGLLARLFTVAGDATAPIMDAPWIVAPLATAIGAAIVLVTLARTRHQDADESWPTITTSALLASPLGWVYYAWWVLPGTRPTELLFDSPLLWVPLSYMVWARHNPWLMATIGSFTFWSFAILWLRRMLR